MAQLSPHHTQINKQIRLVNDWNPDDENYNDIYEAQKTEQGDLKDIIKEKDPTNYVLDHYQPGEPIQQNHEPDVFGQLKRLNFFDGQAKIIHAHGDGNCFLHALKLNHATIDITNEDYEDNGPYSPIKKNEIISRNLQKYHEPNIEKIRNELKKLMKKRKDKGGNDEKNFLEQETYDFIDTAIDSYLRIINPKYSEHPKIENLVIITQSHIIVKNVGYERPEWTPEFRPELKNKRDGNQILSNYAIIILHDNRENPHYDAIPYRINEQCLNHINFLLKNNTYIQNQHDENGQYTCVDWNDNNCFTNYTTNSIMEYRYISFFNIS